ncbi:MAG: hypothetical protein IJW37_02285 [Lachnospiraceae bacterium]|nr:hypothetical protein [Lachnospiraceae bacterium]
MKQGRTVGSYFVFLFKEVLFRLRKEFFSWRGLLALLILAYVIVDTLTAEKTGRLTSLGVGVIWLILLFPPRIGKLLYLLPFSEGERKRYLGTYAVTYISFLSVTLLLVGAVASLIADYPYLTWVMCFVCSTVPFLMLYSGIMLFGMVSRKSTATTTWWFYSTRQTWDQPVDYVGGVKEDCKSVTAPRDKKKMKDMTPEERKAKKKDIFFGIVTVGGSVVTAFHCYGYWMLPMFGANEKLSFGIGTIVAYVCGFAAVLVYVSRIAEELNSTGSTGKEECGCNS